MPLVLTIPSRNCLPLESLGFQSHRGYPLSLSLARSSALSADRIIMVLVTKLTRALGIKHPIVQVIGGDIFFSALTARGLALVGHSHP